MEVNSVADSVHILEVHGVSTQVGSRTGTVDPKTGRVYLMAQYDAGRARRSRARTASGCIRGVGGRPPSHVGGIKCTQITMMSLAAVIAVQIIALSAHAADDGPYRVLRVVKVGGDGGFDYVRADATNRSTLYYAPR